MSAALALVPVVLVVGAMLAAASAPARAAHVARWSSGTAFALAVVVLVVAVVGDPVRAVATVEGIPVGLVAGPLGATLVAFATGTAFVVLTYAGRNLRDDPGQRRMAALGLGVAAGTTAVVAGAGLVVLAAGWLAVSACTLALVRHPSHPGSPRAVPRLGARAVLPMAVGDVALVLAVVVATAAWGHIALPLTEVGALPAATVTVGPWSLDAAALAGTLLVVAAAARSAALPLHGWLVASLDAPSPVSALLHGGVVNAGGLLLVLTWPIVAAAGPGLVLAALVGSVAVLVGGSAMAVRPDVKGALVLSTIAQMGFVLVQVAVGLVGAAVLHLVAHGAYKAGRFLDAGRLTGHDAHGPLARAATVGAAPLGAGLVAAGVGAVALVGLGRPAAEALWPLVPFALATAAFLAASWVAGRRPSPLTAGAAAVVAGALAAAYVAVAYRVEVALVGEPAGGAGVVSGWALVALAPAALVLALALADGRRRHAAWVDRAWAAAIALGQPAPPSTSARAWRGVSPTPARLVTDRPRPTRRSVPTLEGSLR